MFNKQRQELKKEIAEDTDRKITTAVMNLEESLKAHTMMTVMKTEVRLKKIIHTTQAL